MDAFIISERRERFEVTAQVHVMGDDLFVILYGGVKHIGAVAMAQSRPSLSNPRKSGATSSVFTYLGHKEDIIVKAVSEGIAKKLNKHVVVAAGIHWDELKAREIKVILDICGTLTKKVVTALQKEWLK